MDVMLNCIFNVRQHWNTCVVSAHKNLNKQDQNRCGRNTGVHCTNSLQPHVVSNICNGAFKIRLFCCYAETELSIISYISEMNQMKFLQTLNIRLTDDAAYPSSSCFRANVSSAHLSAISLLFVMMKLSKRIWSVMDHSSKPTAAWKKGNKNNKDKTWVLFH